MWFLNNKFTSHPQRPSPANALLWVSLCDNVLITTNTYNIKPFKTHITIELSKREKFQSPIKRVWARHEGSCHSCKFLLRRRLLCGPERCRMSSGNASNVNWQKQQLNLPGVLVRPSFSLDDMTFRCTEHKCFSRCAFCLNIATQSRHANGFSPVWTRRWVLRFHDIPNCFPQYSQRYSRTGACLLEPCSWSVDGASSPPICGWQSHGPHDPALGGLYLRASSWAVAGGVALLSGRNGGAEVLNWCNAPSRATPAATPGPWAYRKWAISSK